MAGKPKHAECLKCKDIFAKIKACKDIRSHNLVLTHEKNVNTKSCILVIHKKDGFLLEYSGEAHFFGDINQLQLPLSTTLIQFFNNERVTIPNICYSCKERRGPYLPCNMCLHLVCFNCLVDRLGEVDEIVYHTCPNLQCHHLLTVESSVWRDFLQEFLNNEGLCVS